MGDYFLVLILRILYFLFELHERLMKPACYITIMGFMPFLFIWTIIGVVKFDVARKNMSQCFPEEAKSWMLITMLCVNFFLLFVYLILLTSMAIDKLRTSRYSFFYDLIMEDEVIAPRNENQGNN